MFRTILKLFRFCLYALLIIIGITFAVSNRQQVDLKFYPLPFEFQTYLFLLSFMLFMLGLVVGSFITYVNGFGLRLNTKAADKRIAALENELSALRSEQLIRPVALPYR